MSNSTLNNGISDGKTFAKDNGSGNSGYGKDAIGGGHVSSGASKSTSAKSFSSTASRTGLGSDDDSGDANPSSNVGVGSSSKGITSA